MELIGLGTYIERIRLPQFDIHVVPSFSRAKQRVQTRYTFLHRDVQILTIRIRVLAVRSSLVTQRLCIGLSEFG
jgi:hypothetical protein